MNIIDSSLWIDYFNGKLKNNSIIGKIEDSGNQCVPSICLYEVYKKIFSEKDEPTACFYTSFMQNATVINVTPQIAILAARLGKELKLPMADSIIYATAQIHDAEIYTQDKHFDGLWNVHYFVKA